MDENNLPSFPTFIQMEKPIPDVYENIGRGNIALHGDNLVSVTVTVKHSFSEYESVKKAVTEICQRVLECYR